MHSNNLSRFSNLCLAILMACPWGFLFCLPVMIVGTQMVHYADRLLVRTDGMLAATSSQYVNQVKSLEGKTLPKDLNHEFLAAYPTLRATFDDPFAVPSQQWNAHLNVIPDDQDPDNPQLWYIVRDRQGSGLTFFQDYSVSTRKPLGFIGTKGSRDTVPPPDERFQLASNLYLRGQIHPFSIAASEISAGTWGSEYGYPSVRLAPQILTSDGTWWEINLTSKTVRKMLPATKLISIEFGGYYIPRADPNLAPEEKKLTYKPMICGRTNEELLWLTFPHANESAHEVQRIQIPEPLRQRDLAWIHFADRSGLLAATLGYNAESNEDRYLIQRHDAAGKFSEPETIGIKRHPTSPLLFSAVPILLPPAVSAAIAANETGLFSHQPKQSPEGYLMRQSWLIFVIMGLVCAGITFIHARRNKLTLPEQIAYMLLGLFGGLAGLAGYLTHRHWPLPVQCPSCKTSAPLLQETCSACQHEFPDPSLLGTEIFA